MQCSVQSSVIHSFFIRSRVLKLLLRIRKVSDSNLGSEIGYPDWGFSWLFSLPPGDCQDCTLSHNSFLPNLLLFIILLTPYHVTLYSILVTEKASHNKLQISWTPFYACIYIQCSLSHYSFCNLFNDDFSLIQNFCVWWKYDKWKMNCKRFGRKRSWPNLKYYPGICLEGPRKSEKPLSQDSRFMSRDFNPGPLEYEAQVLSTEPRRFGPYFVIRHIL
jgi:hypothetical protein